MLTLKTALSADRARPDSSETASAADQTTIAKAVPVSPV